ncbi:MAG: hypothetical protein J2P17_25370 [Mycobacterium sp.]|nr:hypothetical protein [Mycobacterium sp.]
MRARVLRALGAVLLCGGALLAAAPSAGAATPQATAASEELLPPTLTSASLQTFDHVVLRWTPSATGQQAHFYRVYGDGTNLGVVARGDQTFASFDPVTSGAKADSVFTVVAEDVNGNMSAPSNGLRPTPDQTAPDLLPPTLTSATIRSVNPDEVRLVWTPAETASKTSRYLFYGDGKYLVSQFNDGTQPPDQTNIFTRTYGTNTEAKFTVVAEDADGNVSKASNALVPVPEKTLPAPTVTSAVIQGDKITMTWTPSSTTEVSGDLTYHLFAHGSPVVDGQGAVVEVTNQTSATFGTSMLVDPVTPIVDQIKPGTPMSVIAEDRTGAQSPMSNALPAATG